MNDTELLEFMFSYLPYSRKDVEEIKFLRDNNIIDIEKIKS